MHGTRQRGLCRVPRIRHSANRVLDIFLKISSLSSAFTGALGKDISKKKILCRALCQGHSAKYFQKKIFAECQIWDTRQRNFFLKKNFFAECLTAGTRQRRTWPNTVTRGSLCRVPRFCRESGTRQRSPLPSALFCRVPGTRQRTLCRVQFFAECGTRQRRSLPSARFLTLSKEFCTRQRLCFQ